MAQNVRDVVIGVFQDETPARQAVDELKRFGFADEQIGVVTRHAEGMGDDPEDEGAISGMGEAAAAGAIGGASVGAFWTLALAAGAIPAVGPLLIAGGLLTSFLLGTVGGAAIGTVIGALVGLGLSEEEASWYHEEVRAGRIVIVIRTTDRYNEAFAILRRHGAYDIETGPPPADMVGATSGTVIDVPARAGEPGAGASGAEGDAIRVPIRNDELHPAAATGGPTGNEGRSNQG